MLVLTRRENEKIVFPAIDTCVQVLEVKAGRVRIGIEAPPELQILRDEVLRSDGGAQAAKGGLTQFVSSLLRKTKHDMRNNLNRASVGLALAKRQLKAGMLDDVQVTLDKVNSGFQDLELQVENLAPPAKQPERKVLQALLVEDDSNECELLAGFLRLAGYNVNTAPDGADALDCLHNGLAPDVMLLDMNLPRCDGATTVRMIRRDPALSQLKIFAVSGYSPGQLGLDERTLGIEGWFQKPLNPEALLGKLSALSAPSASVAV